MDLIERFQYLMKLQQKTASSFADEIGVQRSSVSHILSGRNKPSLEFIQKVLLKYPKVDANWLINGVAKLTGKQLIQETTIKEQETIEKSDVKEKTKVVETQRNRPLNEAKRIKKILVFYEDQTFEEFKS